ncbi:MAG: DNA polymerase IV [Firmicutes bacterium]|nr:DNA polymerase IV [Bacillota bacterium]MDI6706448.1 DNA polymerase IV [Bacillota bacterium]
MERRIIHFDIDAFFASVEQLDNPELKGKPVIVGGTGKRGVVSTCSYEARRFGIHSAMPMFIAKKKCPDGVYLMPRHNRYAEISEKIFCIFDEYSALVERLSIDEAFLDATGNPKTAMEIAMEIKQRVVESTGLTISAGISYNKFLAKLASDWNKPDGLFVIAPEMVPAILYPLSVNKVYGIGKKAQDKLNSLGIYTIKDLLTLNEERMKSIFGKQGKEIFDRIRGKDERAVISHREVKSVGRETTFERDTTNREMLKAILFEFSKEIAATLYDRNLFGRTVTVKIRTSSFKTITRSKSGDGYLNGIHNIHKAACSILEEIIFDEPVRLIGISVSNLTAHPTKQLSIFEKNYDTSEKIDKLLLDLNRKFGDNALKFGVEMKMKRGQ